MKNAIDARVSFSYQGKEFAPSVTIDLDALIESGTNGPDFHHLIAQANGIDRYSYEYEVMQLEEIMFSNASGLAETFLVDCAFDMEAFRQCWQEERESEMLQRIASEYMNIQDLGQHPELEKTLKQAYDAGKKDAGKY